MQDPDGDEVDDETDHGEREHQAAGHRLRRLEPPNRFPHDPERDDEERRAIQERGENLPTQVAICLFRTAGLPAHPCHEQRQRERARVGEHVPGVGQQRERVRHQSAHRLGDHERQR